MIYPDKIIKSNRRTMSLSISREGAIVVRAPNRIKEQDINKFVTQKQDWLISKLAEIQLNQNKFSDIIEYQKFLLFGLKYEIALADIKRIETNGHTILVPKTTEQEKILPSIIHFYKKKAKEIISKRVAYIKSIMHIEPKAIKITNSRGRWGACNSNKNISFNWRIIMLSPACIDYVIVHELCHLVEMNHSKRFWTLVETFLPNYNDLRAQKKEYGFLLDMYR